MSEWKSVVSAPRDGTLCAIKIMDGLGEFEIDAPHFLHDDGRWYRTEPPTLINGRVTEWREWANG